MSTIDPPPPPEDEFMKMMQGSFGEAPSVEDIEDDVIDVQKLNFEQLADMNATLLDDLMNMGEAIRPRSQKARDMHSLRNAIQIEIRRREDEREGNN